MTVLRTIVLAVLLALGTVLVAWWAVPLVAAACGAITHATRRPGFSAAVAGVRTTVAGVRTTVFCSGTGGAGNALAVRVF